jgi:archaellum component FlaD/FlaE
MKAIQVFHRGAVYFLPARSSQKSGSKNSNQRRNRPGCYHSEEEEFDETAGDFEADDDTEELEERVAKDEQGSGVERETDREKPLVRKMRSKSAEQVEKCL